MTAMFSSPPKPKPMPKPVVIPQADTDKVQQSRRKKFGAKNGRMSTLLNTEDTLGAS